MDNGRFAMIDGLRGVIAASIGASGGSAKRKNCE